MATVEKLSLPRLMGDRSSRVRSGDLFSSSRDKAERRYECMWEDESVVGKELPNVIVLSGSNEFDGLFADISTFYSEYSPITAHLHVVDNRFQSATSRTLFDSLSWSSDSERNQRVGAFVALAIAEVLTGLYEAGGDEEGVSFSLCRRTLSYAIARSQNLYPRWPIEDVAHKWAYLREILRIENRRVLNDTVLQVCGVVTGNKPASGSLFSSEILIDAVIDLYRGGLSPEGFAAQLATIYPRVSGVLASLSGDFDRRLPGLEKIIDSVREQSRGVETDALAIAFFTNLVLPGSFTYAKYLGRLVGYYPSILLWYGFFSACKKDFDWKRLFSGIGAKLARDILNKFDVGMRPTADIAVEELAVLSRIGLKSSFIKPAQPRALQVSLLPGVDVLVRFAGEDDGDAAQHGAISKREGELLQMLSDRDRRLSVLLQQALDLTRDSSGLQIGLADARKPRRPRAGRKVPGQEI